MTSIASRIAIASQAPRLFRSVERLRGALLWLTGFAGAFVFMEPSPYEVASLLTIFVFVCTGLTLRPALMPLIVLLLLYNIGFSLAVRAGHRRDQAGHLGAVSWYLSATAIFFAAMLGTNTAGAALAADARHHDGGGVRLARSRSSPISALLGPALRPVPACTAARRRPSTIRTCSARS